MWPYFDPEYENLNQRINPPRVCIDNNSCPDCTLVKVDNMNKPGILLEVVQVLSDLDLTISKAYITSDGRWFMDVFHVTNQQGRKLTDRKTIEYIEKVGGKDRYKERNFFVLDPEEFSDYQFPEGWDTLVPQLRTFANANLEIFNYAKNDALGPESNILGKKGNAWIGKTVGMHSIDDHTAIELIGSDRPGLLSEIFAVLRNLQCNVIAAEMWAHNSRVACVVYVNDSTTSGAVNDPNRLSAMEQRLRNVLRGRGDDVKGARTSFSIGSTHVDRRLHQLMFADKDYENDSGEVENTTIPFKPVITIELCEDKGYSVVNVKCKDRPKLLFDIVCTLTDMQFAVFHASVSSDGPYASQELYIRQIDGCILDSKAEMERVVKCLEAAILRRVSEGFSLELCGRDRVGLLSDVTRVLREYGLSVTRAGVTTVGEQAMNVFYVSDASGKPVDMKTIDDLRREIGHTVMLNVKRAPPNAKAQDPETSGWAKTSFSFGSLLGKFLHQ